MENIYKRAIINSNKVVEYMQDDFLEIFIWHVL